MASQASAAATPPTNFYLRNPLALLLDKSNLVDSEEADLTHSRIKVANGSTERRTSNTKGSGENIELIVAPFIAEDSATKGLIIELANLVEASQQKEANGDAKAQEDDPKVKRNLTAEMATSKRTPYQLLYSKTFQCYTSLAFYGALLTQLRRWVKLLDSASPKFRGVVWAHLMCMIGSDQHSTEPFGVVLQSILSQPKMDLMDVELLHLSILLSAKLVPQLLSPPASLQSSQSGPVQAKENGHNGEHKIRSEAHGEAAPSGSPGVSGPEEAKERKDDAKTTASTPHNNPTEAAAVGSDGESGLGEQASSSGAVSPTTTSPAVGSSSSPSTAMATSSASSVPAPSQASTSSLSSSSCSSSSIATEAFSPPSAELIAANAVAFSHHYRLRVFQLHSDLFLQIETQRRLLAALASPLIGSTGPSQRELSLALSLRHLTALQAWVPRLDALPPSSRDLVLSAVQNVPSLRTSLQAAKTISHIVQKWELAPLEHASSISALFNALRLLQDFGVLTTIQQQAGSSADFSLQAVAAAALHAGQGALNAAQTPLSMLVASNPASTAAPATSSTSAASGPGESTLSAASSSPLVQPPPLTTPLGWARGSLPWSPVPSPLTTFPGPFGSASPLTFIGPRASPLTSVHSGHPGSSPSPIRPVDPTFITAAPSGVLLPSYTRPAPSNGLPGLKTGSDIADRPAPSSSFSFLSGRSAFGALKRAAEEEAENDLPAKRPKFAEY